MFKNKVERDRKEKIRGIKSKSRRNGEQDLKSSNQSSSKIFSEDDDDDDEDTPKKVISMKEYLDGFCQKHNIRVNPSMLIKLPMNVYLNSAQNGAFVEYKKGKIFELLEKTKQRLKNQDTEEQETINMLKRKLSIRIV